MSVTNLVFYDSADTAESDPLTFSNLETGTPSAAQTLHLWNAKGSAFAETGTEIRVSVLAKGPLDTDYSSDTLPAAQRWIEGRIVGQTGTGIAAQTTSWTPIGKNRYIKADPIPTNCARYFEFRVNAPPGIGTAYELNVVVTVDWARPAVPVSDGISETGGDGVCIGLGDGTASFLVSGGVLTETGTPDAFVNFTDIVYVHKGIHLVILADNYELTNLDGNAAALAAGEAYWATLYLDEDGTVKDTRSAKATSPLSTGTRPAVPAGGILLAYVQRDFDAAIANADIFQDAVYRGLFSSSSSGLVLTLGPGRAFVDNFLLDFQLPQTITLTASNTCSVWLTKNGSLEETLDGTRPSTEERALLLYVCTTDGSSITATANRRKWTGADIKPVQLQFISEVNNNDYSLYATWPSHRAGMLLPVAPVVADIDDVGTSAASASWKFDVFMSTDGGADTTLFTSSGTVDRRPVIAWNDTTLRDTDAVPEVVSISPYARLRAKLVAEPGSITVGPAGARVTLLVAEV
jgi:hypothetical protein